jgi:hypothetical protein
MGIRRQWAWGSIVSLFFIVLLYPLSYAPVAKLWITVRGYQASSQLSRASGRHVGYLIIAVDEDDLPIYRPVDWLIDHTPLRTPLLIWAEMWGMRYKMENAARFRIYGPWCSRLIKSMP